MKSILIAALVAVSALVALPLNSMAAGAIAHMDVSLGMEQPIPKIPRAEFLLTLAFMVQQSDEIVGPGVVDPRPEPEVNYGNPIPWRIIAIGWYDEENGSPISLKVKDGTLVSFELPAHAYVEVYDANVDCPKRNVVQEASFGSPDGDYDVIKYEMCPQEEE